MAGKWRGREFSVTGDYGAAQTNTSLVAAQGANTRIYITSVAINTAGAGTFKLIDGSGGSSLVGTVSLPNTSSFTATFDPGVEATANTALCFTSDYAGVHCVVVTGYVSGVPS
jgi:hypothetical protein